MCSHPKEREQLEEHLSVCPACTEELQALEAYLGAMHSLKRIDAPADFIQSVHDRIEKTSFLRRLVKKIFVPFHIKIPLELAGVVAALLIAVFSYHEMNLQKEDDRAACLLAKSPMASPKSVQPGRQLRRKPMSQKRSVRTKKALSDQGGRNPLSWFSGLVQKRIRTERDASLPKGVLRSNSSHRLPLHP